MPFCAESKVLIQGITGVLGQIQAERMVRYGTRIVAGVTPGRGGSTLAIPDPLPVFDLVEQAIAQVGSIDVSVLFVSPYSVLDAGLEAIAAGIRQLVLISEGVPPLDMVSLLRVAEQTDTTVIGPNSPGVIVPAEILLGIHPPAFYTPGSVGVISRSGTLTFEVALALTQAGLGQSVCVGIGGDPIVGSSFPQWLQLLEEDERTQAIVLVGEIGGSAEEEAAYYIEEAIEKPVIAYIAGITAPSGQRMGHAGAVINPAEDQILARALSPDHTMNPYSPEVLISTLKGTDSLLGRGTAQHKIALFQELEIPVADRPSQIPSLLRAFVN
jgi:succinyl-CoA synthetase alpha subunit